MSKTSNSSSYLLQGLKILGHPKIRHFVIIPLVINILVFSALLLVSVHQFHNLTAWIDSFLPSWLLWLDWLLWILFSLAFLIIIAYTFNIIANIIGAPFNALLAVKVEQLVTGKANEISLKDSIKDIPRAIKLQLHVTLYYLPRALVCLILFFIPALNAIAPFVLFLFNSWMMGLQYLTYPMDNNRLSFKQVKGHLQKQKSANLIFGITVMIGTMIPIVNFVVMPAAVAGATLFWVERFKN